MRDGKVRFAALMGTHVELERDPWERFLDQALFPQQFLIDARLEFMDERINMNHASLRPHENRVDLRYLRQMALQCVPP